MADFDAKLPIRSLAADNTTEIADSAGTTINPAKEDGHLATIDTSTATTATNTTTLAGGVSGGKYQENLAQIGGSAYSLGQNTMANSAPVVIASDQSTLPVSFTDTTVELPQYNTASAIASNASSTQSYTPGSTVNLDGVDFGASGQAKVEIQYGTTGSETTKVVLFTSKGNLNASWRLPHPVQITSAMTVKVIRTNLDNQAMDVYSTILVH